MNRSVRIRFSLSSVLIGIAMLGILLACYSLPYRSWTREREAIQKLRGLGFSVDTRPRECWYSKLYPESLRESASILRADTNKLTADWDALRQDFTDSLAHLKTLDAFCYSGHRPEVNDADLAAISTLQNLQTLQFVGTTGITDEGTRHLVQLRKLESLYLVHSSTGGRTAVYLSRLPNLNTLYIDTRVFIKARELSLPIPSHCAWINLEEVEGYPLTEMDIEWIEENCSGTTRVWYKGEYLNRGTEVQTKDSPFYVEGESHAAETKR